MRAEDVRMLELRGGGNLAAEVSDEFRSGYGDRLR